MENHNLHWFLNGKKVHAYQPIYGEPHFLSACGRRVHPVSLKKQIEKDTDICLACCRALNKDQVCRND